MVQVQPATHVAQTPPPPGGDGEPAGIAARTLDAHRTPAGYDLNGVKRDVERIRAQDPDLGASVATEVEARLTPVQRGEYARAGFSVSAPDGGAITIDPDAPSVGDYRAMPAGSEGRGFYDRLDRLFGDGQYATDDTALINAGLNDMIASGQTLAQREAQAAVPTAANDSGPDPVQLGLDLTQMTLDITGIVEPTPFSDGANTVISAGRAIGSLFSGDFSDAGGHALNGVLSVAGVLPYLGDAAKVGKIGKWAQTVADAVGAIAANPALRGTLEPALREIRDLVGRIPQGAIDALPASARESLERMKTQLDEFFGAGARRADPPATIGDTANVGQTIRVNGQDVTIGAAPTVGRTADGTPTARNANGDDVSLRQPATYDSRTVNADGTVTYTRGGDSVRYDANGFPVFNSRADVYLPPDKIAVGSRSTHFTEANRLLARNSDDQLRAAGFSNAEIAQLSRGETPDNMTWHHHQDVGRMQLVRREEHAAFSGGHTGGWSLWGDAQRFTVE